MHCMQVMRPNNNELYYYCNCVIAYTYAFQHLMHALFLYLDFSFQKDNLSE